MSTESVCIFPVIFIFVAFHSQILVSFLAKLIQQWFLTDKEARNKLVSLQEDLNMTQNELAVMSPIKEFANYARKQRRLEATKTQLKTEKKNSSTKSFGLSLCIQSMLYLPFILISLYISTYGYWSVPIIEFGSNWFYPLNYFMSFPGLTVTKETTQLSIQFLTPILWYLSRMTTAAIYSQ